MKGLSLRGRLYSVSVWTQYTSAADVTMAAGIDSSGLSQMLEAEAQRVAGNEPLMSSESQCHVSCVWYCVLDLGRKLSTRFYNLGLQSINFREAFRTFDFVCLILLLFPWANPR